MSAQEASLVNVYDDEYRDIQKLGATIQTRWRDTARHIDIANNKDTATKVNEFSKWVEGEFEKIGFLVAVDITPIYADRPPSISVLARTNPQEFDHERKAREVRKSFD